MSRSRRAAGVLVALCCLAAAPASAPPVAVGADRDCGYSRFPKTEGEFRYYYILQVKVERGSTGCALALRLMTAYVRNERTLAGWRCTESAPGAVWRCRYVAGKAIVVARALG